MKKVSLVFPGQGSQFIGMGKDLYQDFPMVKEKYDFATKYLQIDIKRLCFEADILELSSVYNCQLAMLLTDIIYFDVLMLKIKNSFRIEYLAGHSLGEIVALYASQALSFEDTLALCKKRAEVMQDIAKDYPGGMIAVLGLRVNEVEDLLKDNLSVANLNCQGQVIISGLSQDLEKFTALAKQRKIKIKRLNVGGPFHSKFMNKASLKLKDFIDTLSFRQPKIPIVVNTSALPVLDIDELKSCIANQISSKVLWEDSIKYIANQGVELFIEVGPNNVLSKIIKRIVPNIEVVHAKEIIYGK
jgi:[acyl-carrier-protein] S-malonyltransferase